MAVTYRLLLDKKRKIENAAAGVCVFLAHPAACVELIVPLLVLFAGGDLNQLLQMEEAQSVRFLHLLRQSSHGFLPIWFTAYGRRVLRGINAHSR